MSDAFDGIKAKLERSYQNVLNLESEVNRFFQESAYPVIPQDDAKLLLQAMQYHQSRAIPLRFSVLAGEIVHHLRSVLDHIIWVFSDPSYREERSVWIEFPILKSRPIDKDSVKRFERKIKGISDTRVVGLITGLQPYNSTDPANSFLSLIHDMDIIDKHKELVMCFCTPGFALSADIANLVIREYRTYHKSGIKDPVFEDAFQRKLENHAKITPTISFANFAGREFEAVVPAIMVLNNEVVRVVAEFDRFLPR